MEVAKLPRRSSLVTQAIEARIAHCVTAGGIPTLPILPISSYIALAHYLGKGEARPLLGGYGQQSCGYAIGPYAILAQGLAQGGEARPR